MEIIRQEVECEKEDRRTGRVRVSQRVLWFVVENGEMLRECETRREAKEYVERHKAK